MYFSTLPVVVLFVPHESCTWYPREDSEEIALSLKRSTAPALIPAEPDRPPRVPEGEGPHHTHQPQRKGRSIWVPSNAISSRRILPIADHPLDLSHPYQTCGLTYRAQIKPFHRKEDQKSLLLVAGRSGPQLPSLRSPSNKALRP